MPALANFPANGQLAVTLLLGTPNDQAIKDAGQSTSLALDVLAAEYTPIPKPGEAVLAHSDFTKKVAKVLGQIDAQKVFRTQKYGNNNERGIYVFSRKEAIRMAMSYSYDLQTAVLDAGTRQKPS